MKVIIKAALFNYQIPFVKAINFNGHLLKHRHGLILQLQNNYGDCHYGEIAPLPGFSRETFSQAKQQIISCLNKGVSDLSARENLYASVNFGLGSALQQLSTHESSQNMDPIPLLQGDNIALIEQYKKLKHPLRIKLKVARQPIENDIYLFNQLVSLNPEIMIRCDANRQWSYQQAEFFFNSINREHLEYVEEPTENHKINIQLAEKNKIYLGLDETLQDLDFNYQAHGCIKALVLKPTLIGSLNRVERFIELAVQHKLQVHISSSFESVVGLQQLIALTNIYQRRCSLSLGIDTLKYFQTNLLTNPLYITQDIKKLECIWKSY